MLYQSQPGRSGKSTVPFVLDEPRLQKFREIFASSGEALTVPHTVRYSVRRDDPFSYTTQDCREVLRDDNAKGREIVELGIELVVRRPSDSDDSIVASVTFSRATSALEETSAMEYVIDYPDRSWCSDLVEEIKEQFVRAEALHRPRIPAWLGTVIGVGAWVLVLIMFYTFVFAPDDAPPLDQAAFSKLGTMQKLDGLYGLQQWLSSKSSHYETFYFVTIVLGAISILCHSVKPLSRLQGTMQRSYFLWGDQIEQYRLHEGRVRGRVAAMGNAIVVIGLGVVASIFAEPVLHVIREFLNKHHLG